MEVGGESESEKMRRKSSFDSSESSTFSLPRVERANEIQNMRIVCVCRLNGKSKFLLSLSLALAFVHVIVLCVEAGNFVINIVRECGRERESALEFSC
jgi:hypothetical protein